MTLSLDWIVFLIRFGLGIALVVVCAQRAKTAGGGLWLVGAFGAILAFFALVHRVLIGRELQMQPSLLVAIRAAEAGFFFIGALLALVGFALLRT